MNDTHPEMHKKRLEIIFRLTPEERLSQGFEMMEFAQNAVKNSILNQNATLSETELKVEVFKRYYANDFSDKEKERIFRHFRAMSEHPSARD